MFDGFGDGGGLAVVGGEAGAEDAPARERHDEQVGQRHQQESQGEVLVGDVHRKRREDLAHDEAAHAEAHHDHASGEALLVGKPPGDGGDAGHVTGAQADAADDAVAEADDAEGGPAGEASGGIRRHRAKRAGPREKQAEGGDEVAGDEEGRGAHHQFARANRRDERAGVGGGQSEAGNGETEDAANLHLVPAVGFAELPREVAPGVNRAETCEEENPAGQDDAAVRRRALARVNSSRGCAHGDRAFRGAVVSAIIGADVASSEWPRRNTCGVEERDRQTPSRPRDRARSPQPPPRTAASRPATRLCSR